MGAFYHITVKAVGKRFDLFNERSGAFAGDRLRKGENAKISWPFHGKVKWWTYPTAKEANAAAVKLQDYLDKFEHNKAKAKKGEE